MNIVIAGSRVQVFGEDVQTYKTLPIGSYDVCFHKMSGFYLTVRRDLEAREDKVYGNHLEKVNKVLRSFDGADRNFGIILSGQKGIGKSLFARLLAEECIKKDIPVITVTSYIPGIANFLASIDQEVAVIFDEFEKTFGKSDDFDPQEDMLSLFDGIDNGKKLFVITCNEVSKLNSYFINRPGRFHYHFTIENPSPDEVREYMTDKLQPKYHFYIDKLVNFSQTINMTYDYLRAIAFELNQGYTLEESLSDLNITNVTDVRFNVDVTFENDRHFCAYDCRINLYDSRRANCRLTDIDGNSIWMSFTPTDITLHRNDLILNPTKAHISWDSENYWTIDDDDEAAAAKAADRALKVKSIDFYKTETSSVLRYLV